MFDDFDNSASGVQVDSKTASKGSKPVGMVALGPVHQCTFVLTGKKHRYQWMQHCKTCFGNDATLVACLQCVQHCHFGHALDAAQWIKGFCDTGAYQSSPPCTNPFILPAFSTRTKETVESATAADTVVAGSLAHFPGSKTVGMDQKTGSATIPLVPLHSRDSFAIKMMKALVSTTARSVPGESLVHSPWNIGQLLSLLALAATNTTKKELETVLNLSDASKLLPVLAANHKWINSVKGIAQRNWMFLSPTASIKTAFTQSIASFTQVQPWLNTVDPINKEVKAFTNGMIPELLKPSDIPPNAQLVLLSVLYLKMALAQAFDSESTLPRAFTTSFATTDSDSQRLVPLMSMRKKSFRYYESKDCQYVELPYADNNQEWVMGFIRPQNVVPINNPVAFTVPDASSFHKTKLGTLWIPKFRRTFRVSLKAALKLLGLGACFQFANGKPLHFGNLSDEDLAVSDIITMCVVDFNEIGVEAAAATVAVLRSKGISVNQDPDFLMDQPGGWYLRHLPSGEILFQDIFD